MADEKMSMLNELCQLARRLGATDAAVVAAGDIPIEDDLANRCREPRCENYGLSPSCPPHVAGPAGFRELRAGLPHAVVIRIDVTFRMLLSNERDEIMQLLHEIVAGVEMAATRKGCPVARGFAGGSCKSLFCRNHRDCRVLAGGGTCRNPHCARPSMSGFGINVAGLMALAGWPVNGRARAAGDNTGEEATAHVTGLVLVGPADA